MHRSDPIAAATGAVFLGALVVAFVWTHDFPRRVDLAATAAWLAFASAAGFFLWWHGMRLRALVRDIPTSVIASAPQGYVELVGRARSAGDRIPGASDFYLWKRTSFASRAGRRANIRAFPFNLVYVVHSIDLVERPFCIEDASGRAIVLPNGAEVICGRREVQYTGDQKIVREIIFDGDPLYVTGAFSTVREDIDVATESERLVNDWKQDKTQIERFDINRDGYISGSELLQMHRAAQKEVRLRATDSGNLEGIHTVALPANGRKFLIASLEPGKLVGHYTRYLAVGITLFFSALAGTVFFYRAFTASP